MAEPTPRQPQPLPKALWGARRQGMQQGTGGFEAATVGAVMVGSILAAYFLGTWLDHRLGTTHWMPSLVIVGAIGGFIEMIRTVMRIARRSGSFQRASAPSGPMAAGWKADEASEAELAEAVPAPVRAGRVPPPPEPSFAARDRNGAVPELAKPDLDGLLQQVESIKKMKESLDDEQLRRK